MSGAIPLLPLYAFMTYTGTELPFTVYVSVVVYTIHIEIPLTFTGHATKINNQNKLLKILYVPNQN
jgi:hypothetical protein